MQPQGFYPPDEIATVKRRMGMDTFVPYTATALRNFKLKNRIAVRTGEACSIEMTPAGDVNVFVPGDRRQYVALSQP